MSRLALRLHRPITVVDSWFMWGVIGGVLTVAQLAYQGVPGIALYGWMIPLFYGLILTEDNWHVITVVGMLVPYLIRDVFVPWLVLDVFPHLAGT